ncbi:hypothetical protein [Micromonospora sp. CPCC 206061]|uniref:hypothetical protein n=1 Tax=Micromonospora sp. CPCC 206061 TaxID=3122410 RepID=UPI002FF0D523
MLDGLLRSMPTAVLEAVDGPDLIRAAATPDDAACLLAAITFAALGSLTVGAAAASAMALALAVNFGIYVYFRRRSIRRK